MGVDQLAEVTVVVLTFDRPRELEVTLRNLAALLPYGVEIIVVDNGSTPPASEAAQRVSADIEVLRLEVNEGVGARNRGLQKARGEIVICLDDDVYGIQPEDIRRLRDMFDRNPRIGAVCFSVRDAVTPERIVNWCHHREVERFRDQQFDTDEISEGAFALRKTLIKAGVLFPADFFISHEGVALAVQIMNHGMDVVYSPTISVLHAHSPIGRPGWRRYYFDTRNVFWLGAQYLPVAKAIRLTLLTTISMGVYALRDGHTSSWFRGVTHGFAGVPSHWARRIHVTESARQKLKQVQRGYPSVLYRLRKRLFAKEVRI